MFSKVIEKGLFQTISSEWTKAKKKNELAKQQIPADDYEARLARMDDFIELLEDTDKNNQEKTRQTNEQKAFKGFDLHRLNQAIHVLNQQLKTIKPNDEKEKDLIHGLKDKLYFLHAIREIVMMNREDELRLLTVFFDKGVREREEINKTTGATELLLGKATLLKYVRDKYLNLADVIIAEQNYAHNKHKLKDDFNDLLMEQATVVHHKRFSITDQVRNKAGFTITGLVAGSVVPGLGTAIGGLLGFIADRFISFYTNWNGGASITQTRYESLATTAFKDHEGSKLAHQLHAAHKAERVVHFDLPQAQLAAGSVMATPAAAASASVAPKADAPLITPLSHPEGSSLVTLAEDKAVATINGIYKSGQTMFEEYKLHKATDGYDAYRRHLAVDLHQTPESLAQVRAKPQKG